MAIPSADLLEAVDFASTSAREDLSGTIEDLTPSETPFTTAIGRGKVTNVFHEWTYLPLTSAVATNSVIEGDDATIDAAINPTRVGNYCNIADKTVLISGTMEATSIDLAGINNMKGWQLMKKAQHLKNDVDKQLMSEKASVASASGTARVSAGAESFIYTNDDDTANDLRGTGGSSPGYSAGIWGPPVDGTQRAITEDMLTTALSMCWDQGGSPTKVFCNSFNKKSISGFSGHSTRLDKGEDQKLVAALAVYVGDFGSVDIVPTRHVRTRTVLVVDPTLWSLCFLRGYKVKKLGPTGDSESYLLNCEYVLECANEAGNAAIADLTTS